MIKKLKYYLSFALVPFVTLMVRAQIAWGGPLDPNKAYDTVGKPMRDMAEGAGYNADSSGFDVLLPEMISTIISAFLSLLGLIFLIYVIYAGYSWMTAEGDEAKVTKAKETIQRAIIGLIIIALAYAITYFVFKVMPWGSGGGSIGGGG
jgi:cytochrome bd-type quinol oxidase subunit 2